MECVQITDEELYLSIDAIKFVIKTTMNERDQVRKELDDMRYVAKMLLKMYRESRQRTDELLDQLEAAKTKAAPKAAHSVGNPKRKAPRSKRP